MHTNSKSDSYAAAGVDITAGYKAVELMKEHIKTTLTDGVCSDVGGFGGLFMPNLAGMKQPVLVSGTDGVGTKLKLAFLLDKHDTVGIDCVAMCVNDIICCGARPLFFLDYIACGKNYPEKIAAIVGGVAEGCVQSGCALIGGETAEHPGTMEADDYDLAGFAVGIVDKSKIIDQNSMKVGDVIVALPSSGCHSNGYSLVRKVFDVENADLNEYYADRHYNDYCERHSITPEEISEDIDGELIDAIKNGKRVVFVADGDMTVSEFKENFASFIKELENAIKTA